MAVNGNKQLSVEDLSCAFDGVQAVDDLSFDLISGRIVALIGPNGSGKTTVFNLICGFLKPDAGNVTYEEQAITGKRPDQIARLGLGRTFQDCKVFDQLSVLDNVILGFRDPRNETLRAALMQGAALRASEEDRQMRALDLLEDAGLSDKKEAQACDLSYGQRKLLELCRVRALEPKIFLLDEPFAGLFPATAERMGDMISGLKETGHTVIFIEHDMDVVADLAERVIVLDFGRLIADDTPQEALNDPAVLDAYLGRESTRAS